MKCFFFIGGDYMDSDYYYYYDNDLNIINYTITNGEKYEKRII